MKKKLLFFLVAVMSGFQAMAALSTTSFTNNNYINEWGQLKLVSTTSSGNNKVQLADKNGNPVQLRGWATHGLQWAGTRPYFDEQKDFQVMKDFGANVVRLTCYIHEGANWGQTEPWLKSAIDWCNTLGLYAIVDYHVLTPGNPMSYLSGTNPTATTYFTNISGYVKQKGYKHVLYEICNEPNGGSWQNIKDYAAQVLPTIAANDPNAVVIIGTQQWSQLLNDAKNSKITHSSLQIMYTFHYYNATHGFLLDQQLTRDVLNSIPVIVTEWNDTNKDGRGNPGSSNDLSKFLSRLNGEYGQYVSWTAWSWSGTETESGQTRTSSSFNWNNTQGGNNLTEANLSNTGKMVKSQIKAPFIGYVQCANEVTVTFDCDGGNINDVERVVSKACSGSTISRPSIDPRKTGFQFDGWLKDGAPFNFATTVSSNITLVAKWIEGEPPTVVADCNTDETNLCTTWFGYGDGKGSTVESTEGVVKNNFLVTPEGGFDGGYLNVRYDMAAATVADSWGVGFGFNLDPTSTETVPVAVDLTGAIGISLYTKGRAAIIQLKVIGYSQCFEASLKANTAGWGKIDILLSDFKLPDWYVTGDLKKDKPGYAGDGSLSTEDLQNVSGIQFKIENNAAPLSGTFGVDEITIQGKQLTTCKTVVPCENEVTVTFTNAGTLVSSQIVCADNFEFVQEPREPVAPDGSKFVGWFDADGNKFDFALPATVSVDLTAKFEEVTCTQYTVSFDSNGGSPVDPKKACEGEEISKPTDPTRSEYRFIQWLNDGSPVSFPYIMTTENVEFTAEWEKNVDPNGPTMVADCEYANRTCFGTYWFTYNDSANEGLSVVTPDTSGEESPFTMTEGGANGTANYARVEYSLDKGGNANAPFIGVGFAMAEPKDIYDLSAASGISFYYKGAASRFKVNMGGEGDTETALGWNAYGYNITASTDWKLVEIAWTDLAQLPGWGTALPGGFNPALAMEFQWQVEGATDDEGWIGIDEVQIIGTNLGLSCAGDGVNVEAIESASFAIYPNPAKDGNFNVSLAGSDSAVLSIMNLQGQVVYNAAISNDAAINANLGAGVYVVSVKTANSVQTQKLIVK